MINNNIGSIDSSTFKGKDQKHWIDYLRVIAVFGIISTHTSWFYYSSYGKIGQFEWWLSNFLITTFRFVPMLFVMISGCLLLGKRYSVKQFYTKRATRLIPAFFFWNTLYVCIQFCTQTNMSNPTLLIKAWVRAFAQGQAYGHLWYLSMFIGLMMIVPYLNMFVLGLKPTKKEMIILAFILLIFVCLKQASDMIGTVKNYTFYWHYEAVQSIPFFLMGFYIDKYYKEIKINNWEILSAILSIILIIILLNYIAADHFALVNEGFFNGVFGPFAFAVTSLLFLLFRKNDNGFKHSKLIAVISEASFGIYLIHNAYIYFCQRLLPGYLDRGIIYMPLVILIVVAVSFVTIYLFRKIKIFRILC